MVDVHLHILPGLDDGPPDWATAVEMARQAAGAGIGTVVATPHMTPGHPGSLHGDFIAQSVAEFQGRLQAARVRLGVVPGAEVQPVPGLLSRLGAGEVPTVGQGGEVRYLLLDTPFDVLPPHFEHLLFELRLARVVPILAHPERSRPLVARPDRVASLVGQGVLTQVTAGSLLGMFGPRAQQAGWRWIESGLAHVVASDGHGTGQRSPGELGRAFHVVARRLGQERARLLFCHNPEAVVQGVPVRRPEPMAAPPPGVGPLAGVGSFLQRLTGAGRGAPAQKARARR